jgi:gliding motility-associated-like protein
MKKGRSHILNLFIFLLAGTGVGFAQTALVGNVNVYVPSCSIGAAAVHCTGGVPPYTYTWSNGAVGDSVSNLPAGNYNVHISDSDNSTLTPDIDVTFKVELSCTVTFSNRFSPNADGINDTWSISNWTDYPKFFLQVFDRWGQIVHQQRKQYIPWDGTHFGIHVPDATYYVIFYYEEGDLSKFEKGSVTLVR